MGLATRRSQLTWLSVLKVLKGVTDLLSKCKIELLRVLIPYWMINTLQKWKVKTFVLTPYICNLVPLKNPEILKSEKLLKHEVVCALVPKPQGHLISTPYNIERLFTAFLSMSSWKQVLFRYSFAKVEVMTIYCIPLKCLYFLMVYRQQDHDIPLC